MCDMELREARALDNMRRAIDMMEIFERASIKSHGSYLIHGAIYKSTRDILAVGDVWSVDLSPLELQNAETKRAAEGSGSKHLTFNHNTIIKHPPPMKNAHVEGPQPLVKAQGYKGSMASSTMKHLLAAQLLRRGDAEFALPDSRRKERLFERGRTKPEKCGAAAAPSCWMATATTPPRTNAFGRLCACSWSQRRRLRALPSD